MEVHAIIPARLGSKGISNKNIIDYKGHPLLSWSIKHGLQSKYIDHTFISTDSIRYKEIALSYGAKDLGLRNKNISGDLDRDFTFLVDHLNKIKKSKKFKKPDILIILRPTSPERNIQELDSAILHMKNNLSFIDCIRAVSPASENPYKMWLKNDEGFLNPLIGNFEDDFINSPRQLLPQSFYQNGNFDIINTSSLQKETSCGTRVYPWITSSKGIDIDDEQDIINKTL